MRALRPLCRFILAASLVALAGVVPALAQQNAELNGVVRDPDGLAMPGATVTSTNEATGLSRTVTTGASGGYVINLLPPGTYTVLVQMDGFADQERKAFPLAAGAQATIDWTLRVAGVEEALTVTGEAPLVERSGNTIGGTLGTREIEEVPTNFRNFVTLTALVPGITPTAATSSFEGGSVSANGSPSNQNVFLVDGTYNNDDRLGGGNPQVRLVIDTISEYQVLGNQYSVEYGGGGGAIINMVTKGGTNTFAGRVYGYFRDDRFHSRSPALPAERPKPDESTKQLGFAVGGPIIRNRAHFQVSLENDQETQAGFKTYPAIAKPLAFDYTTEFDVDAINLFARGDLQLTDNMFVGVRYVVETAATTGEASLEDPSLPDAHRLEGDYDAILNTTITNVLTERASNVLRIGQISEDLAGSGSRADYYNEKKTQRNWFKGFDGRDQFDIGQLNTHPAYWTGRGGPGAFTKIRTFTFDDTFSFFMPTGHGDHTFKVGGGFSLNRAVPRSTVDSGTFNFRTDAPFNPADPTTYPFEFVSQVGPCCPNTFDVESKDHRSNFFVEDRWRMSDRFTLTAGVRYDYQYLTRDSKDDFAPRIGGAYDVTGEGKTVFRAGFGRFSTTSNIAQDLDLQASAVITKYPTVTISDPTSPVLMPDMITDSSGNPGVAVLSAAGKAALRAQRDGLLAGTVFNRNPVVDGHDLQMQYQWGWSAGVAHELGANMAVTADYVGNVSRDQMGRIDLNEPINRVRPGVNVFDPDGQIIPAQARATNFQRVLQFQTRKELNGDYKSLQLSFVRRFANRWSMRHAYTLQSCHSVGAGAGHARRFVDDFNPRTDYGRCAGSRTHVLAMSGTYNPWRTLSIAMNITSVSGAAINETVGSDVNGDNDNTDRPQAGVHDLLFPILSDLDDRGIAVINGMVGPSNLTTGLSIRYAIDLGGGRAIDLNYDMFNLTNRLVPNDPTGNRSSSSFNISQGVGFPRQSQFGVRFRF